MSCSDCDWGCVVDNCGKGGGVVCREHYEKLGIIIDEKHAHAYRMAEAIRSFFAVAERTGWVPMIRHVQADEMKAALAAWDAPRTTSPSSRKGGG